MSKYCFVASPGHTQAHHHRSRLPHVCAHSGHSASQFGRRDIAYTHSSSITDSPDTARTPAPGQTFRNQICPPPRPCTPPCIRTWVVGMMSTLQSRLQTHWIGLRCIRRGPSMQLLHAPSQLCIAAVFHETSVDGGWSVGGRSLFTPWQLQHLIYMQSRRARATSKPKGFGCHGLPRLVHGRCYTINAVLHIVTRASKLNAAQCVTGSLACRAPLNQLWVQISTNCMHAPHLNQNTKNVGGYTK